MFYAKPELTKFSKTGFRLTDDLVVIYGPKHVNTVLDNYSEFMDHPAMLRMPPRRFDGRTWSTHNSTHSIPGYLKLSNSTVDNYNPELARLNLSDEEAAYLALIHNDLREPVHISIENIILGCPWLSTSIRSIDTVIMM